MPMQEEPFGQEEELQKLVADHPELLSGEQISPGDPRRWILIRREQGIAAIEGVADRWALDHLLIDQDAIPTLVEVKRSSNPEIRRSIVGQMLEYAAHAIRTWDVGRIRQAFEQSRESQGDALAELLASEAETNADQFWTKVEANLRDARLRLLFVADGIPDELTRVVEFLNEQMPNVEVLAVEVKQFRGDAGQTLVPRVIGRTYARPSRSGVRTRLSPEEFLARLPSPDVIEAAKRLMNVATRSGGFVNYGQAGVSIRIRSSKWRNPLSIAWIFPGTGGWSVASEFTFGINPWDMDEKPIELVRVLEAYLEEFRLDSFASEIATSDVRGWIVSHEHAAENIEVLADRVTSVLTGLKGI